MSDALPHCYSQVSAMHTALLRGCLRLYTQLATQTTHTTHLCEQRLLVCWRLCQLAPEELGQRHYLVLQEAQQTGNVTHCMTWHSMKKCLPCSLWHQLDV